MPTAQQIIKNANKLINTARIKRESELERDCSKIVKAIVSELNSTLKGKPISSLLNINADAMPPVYINRPAQLIFDTAGFLNDVETEAKDGAYHFKGNTVRNIKIKKITWDGKFTLKADNVLNIALDLGSGFGFTVPLSYTLEL